jgi:type IV pilus assembly protein PilM
MKNNPTPLINGLIGLDIGISTLRMTQIAAGKVVRTASAPIPSDLSAEKLDSFIIETIKKIFSVNKFKKAPVSLSLPQAEACVRVITIPVMSKADMPAAVKYAAKRHIAYPAEEAVMNYAVLGEVQEGNSRKNAIVLMATLKSVLERYTAIVKKAGLTLSSVNTGCFALGNLLSLSAVTVKAVVVVEIGQSGADVSFYKEGQLILTRNVPAGGSQFDEIIQEHLGGKIDPGKIAEVKQAYGICGVVTSAPAGGIDPLKYAAASSEYVHQLLNELHLSVSHYGQISHGQEIEKIFLCGAGSLLKGLPDALAQKMFVPVEVMMAPEGYTLSTEFAPFARAFGLALETGGSPNLVTAGRGEAKKNFFDGEPLVKTIAISFGVVFALILAGLIGMKFFYAQKMSAVKQEMSLLDAPKAEILSLKRAFSRIELKREIFQQLTGADAPLADIILQVSEIIDPKKVVLNSVMLEEASAGGMKLMLQGQIESAGNENLSALLEQVTSGLEQTGYFEKVVPVVRESSSRGSIQGKVLMFTVECPLKRKSLVDG